MCHHPLETREHIFFECTYSAEIWKALTKGFLKDQYTSKWVDILQLIMAPSQQKVPRLTLQYVFQAAFNVILRERNSRQHSTVG